MFNIFTKTAMNERSALKIHYDILLVAKIHKNNYDKSLHFFTPILFHEIFAEKSYKMDIYKSTEKVYNKVPSEELIRVSTLFFLHNVCVFCEISI